MAHLSRLTRELRALLQAQRVASLGTIGQDGAALVSMVPFAIEPELGRIVIHISDLAAHTRNLQARPRVSSMVMRAEVSGEPVHALPRVTFDGIATVLKVETDAWQRCRATYLQRFPDAELMTQLPDFKFVALEATGARQVSGFGSARSIGEEEVRLALGPEQ